MSCCCENIFKFCEPVSVCNPETLFPMFKDLPDGTFKLELDFLNGGVVIGIVKVGTGITFTGLSKLNENHTYTGKVRDLNGAVMPYYKYTVPYDCIQFTTKMEVGGEYNLTPTPPPAPEYVLTPEEVTFIKQLKSNYEST